MLSGIVKKSKSGDIQWKFEKICRDKDIDKLKELIQAGWNVNTKFHTSRWGTKEALPLQLAVRDQWVEGVVTLLKAGAKTWQTFEEHYGDRWSRTCLMYACHIANPELVRVLVEYGKPPDVNLRDRYQHFSPLMESIYSCRCEKDLETVEYLLHKGAEVDIIGYKKGFFIFPNSPVTVSVKRENFMTLHLLINYGANLHVTPREHIQSFVKDTTGPYDIPYTLGQYRNQSFLWGHGIVCFTMDLILKTPEEDNGNLLQCLSILLEAGCPVVTNIYKNNSKVREVYSLVTDISMPRSLKWLCRKHLRMDFGLFKPVHVFCLPLPKPLQKYVLCMD